MGISVDSFFDLLVDEVNENEALQNYYKFKDKEDSSFFFRKAYYCQRLQYISDQIDEESQLIWDCGCGYGTTAIFLALNGFKVFGSTLEFYFEEIENRLGYWSKFGDLSQLSFNYENLFDDNIESNSYDVIIAQDTLHHLEPLNDAIGILNKVMRPNGKLIAIEENGDNVVQNFKLYLQRGNKRIITIYDEKLQKDILLGNENIKSLSKWRKAFSKAGLFIDDATVSYIRLFPPNLFNQDKYTSLLKKEGKLWRSNSLLKNRFFFGLNFVVKK